MPAFLLVLIMALGSISPQRAIRQHTRAIEAEVNSDARLVDCGVLLRVVEADPDGEQLIDGAPAMRILREHRRGGVVDKLSNPPCFVGPSLSPVVWYCSTDQEPLILHRGLGDRLLVYGSEGAGKTTAQVMWQALRWLESVGENREGGQTAPTEKRLQMFRTEANKLWPREWYRYKSDDDVYTFVDGTTIRLVSTHQQSAAEGSRVQGYTWSWCGSDEMQDQIERDDDIESRGRGAKRASYKRFATATAKDNYAWRTFRDRCLASGLWTKHTLLGRRSPFVWPKFWDEKRSLMSPREYQRRVDAMDVAPESALYGTFDRDHSVRPVPVSADDVTAKVLAKYGANMPILVGFDPGKICHVAVVLKAYQLPRERLWRWWVVDEITAMRTTVDGFAELLGDRLRSRWNVGSGGRMALLRGDPYGNTPSDSTPDRTVYTVLRGQPGLDVRPAIYKPGTTQPGRISKDARIDMVNTLLCNAKQERRLMVSCDDLRAPAAPKLVEAFETLERDGLGRAEVTRKDINDMTHWPAALGYGLYAIEQPRLAGLEAIA